MTDKNYTHFEKLLLHAYYHGIDEERADTDNFKKTATMKLIDRAYKLGRLTGRSGDKNSDKDYFTNDQILNEINNTYYY